MYVQATYGGTSVSGRGDEALSEGICRVLRWLKEPSPGTNNIHDYAHFSFLVFQTKRLDDRGGYGIDRVVLDLTRGEHTIVANGDSQFPFGVGPAD
jgi:hypothetical protein